MSRHLITGCGGFIGSYLGSFLLDKGMTVYGVAHEKTQNIDHLKNKLVILKCDISDRGQVEGVISESKPDRVFHLAAQSLVSASWQDPERAFRVNVLGTLYLLDGLRKAGIDPVVVIVGSSAEYGICSKGEIPITEDQPFRPASPYGVSKIAQDMLAYAYFRSYRMRIIRVRPFYIIGPCKIGDACSDFARTIVQIERGRQKVLKVGNLEAIRDVVDVRDSVRALWLLAERGKPGEVYNLCSGNGYRIRDLLDILLSLSKANVQVKHDPERMRPADDSSLIGNSSKLRQLGWQPSIPLEKTLVDILDYWRDAVHTGKTESNQRDLDQ